MSAAICIITKPLQYVNLLNIPHLDSSTSTLVMVKSFSNYQKLYDYLIAEGKWQKVMVANTMIEAIKYCYSNQKMYQSLYLNTDIGFKLSIYLFRIKINNIYLYDEGWGSYRSDIKRKYNKSRLLSVLLYKDKNAQYYIGSHPKVKGIYLYFPELHKQLLPYCNKQLGLKRDFLEHIKCGDFKIFDYTCLDSYKDKDILLYLSSWDIDSRIYEIIDNNSNQIRLAKLHPHILEGSINVENFDEIIDSGLMAEFVIKELISKARSLEIYHHNSTSVIYFQNHPKVKLINLTPSKKYEIISEEINKL